MRIHELDESLNKSKSIREAGPFSYGAKKPKKGSLAWEIQQKRKEQDKKTKPIEPKDQMVGVAKIGKVDVKEEFDLCNYHGIELTEKLAIAEAYFTKNSNLFKSNEPTQSDYFLSLTSMSSPLKKNKKYIAVTLGLVDNKIITLSRPDVITLLSKTKNSYKVKLSNGTVTEFPAKHLTEKMTATAFFFSNTPAYDKFKSVLALKFDTSLPNVKIDTKRTKQYTKNTKSAGLDEATYSAGGGIGLDFKVKDTVRHSLLGDVLVVGFDGSSAIVKNSEGKIFKVSPAGLMLVKKATTPTQTAPTQPAPSAVTGAPIGQSIMYSTTKGPVKFTKTSKGWEALFGTVRKIFTSNDDTYNKLEKMWQMQG